MSSAAKQAEAAKAFIKVLTGPSAAAVLKSAGMEGRLDQPPKRKRPPEGRALSERTSERD